MSECEQYLKRAKKAASVLKRDWWTAGSHFRLAADCFENHGKWKEAADAYLQACEALGKYDRDERMSREGQVQTAIKGIFCTSKVDKADRNLVAVEYLLKVLTALDEQILREFLEVHDYSQAIVLVEAIVVGSRFVNKSEQATEYGRKLAILYRDYSKLLMGRRGIDKAFTLLSKGIIKVTALAKRKDVNMLMKQYFEMLSTQVDILIGKSDCQSAATTLHTRIRELAQCASGKIVNPYTSRFLKQISQRAEKLSGPCKEVLGNAVTMLEPSPTTGTEADLEELDDTVESPVADDLESEIFAVQESIKALEKKFDDGLVSTPDYTRLLRGYYKSLYTLRLKLEKE